MNISRTGERGGRTPYRERDPKQQKRPHEQKFEGEECTDAVEISVHADPPQEAPPVRTKETALPAKKLDISA